jgi:exosortase
MATVNEVLQDERPDESERSRTNDWRVLAPYLVAIATQVPMMLLYFRRLWDRPHYQVFPLALIALGIFTYLRWPKGAKRKFQSSFIASLLLFAGLALGLLGYIFVEPWFGAASAACFAASLYARTVAEETNKTLLSLSLLAFFCVRPPFDADQRLISWLQTVSAKFTSELLDLVGYAHYMPGTVFIAPGGKSFEVEQACSGVQSFFSLLFVAILLVVMQRRNWFRGGLLILSAAFWAIFMNTVRILAIPFADWIFQWDLSSGEAHEVLGYLTLLLGILMLLSTDQLLMFVFGPVEAFGEERKSTFRGFTKFWNKVISGQAKAEDKNLRREMTATSRFLTWVAAGILATGVFWNLLDVYRSFINSDLKLRFFDGNVLVPLAEKDLPAELGAWKLSDQGYSVMNRERGSDFGQISDAWTYVAGRNRVIFSFDQAFPGWHDLTICYRNMGWKEPKDVRFTKLPGDESKARSKDWNYVICDFTKETGETGFLVFSLFDAFGEPYDCPKRFDYWAALPDRIIARMNHRIRSSLFRGETYQAQAFISTYGPIDDKTKDEVVEKFLEVREIMRDRFLEHRKAEGARGVEEARPKDKPEA